MYNITEAENESSSQLSSPCQAGRYGSFHHDIYHVPPATPPTKRGVKPISAGQLELLLHLLSILLGEMMISASPLASGNLFARWESCQ
jgi:hypothetical protein